MNPYLSQLKRELYYEYLQTEYWINFRNNFIDIQNYCMHCGEDNPKELIVHHINYNLFYERPYIDVIVLCNKCHRKVHHINC